MTRALIISCMLFIALPGMGQERATSRTDLKAVVIDTGHDEMFQSVRPDNTGRLFVGGKDGLFVYEPGEQGHYLPRKLLYRFPPNAHLVDIEFRGHDLYVLTHNALYVIPNGVRERIDVRPRKVVWGVPANVEHRGFHALTWGPEGDLYFAAGNRTARMRTDESARCFDHWTFFTQPEGTRVAYSGRGGVFRCKPDGTELQVFAEGMDDPRGLTFDPAWHLFSTDNTKPSRLLYLVPHANFDSALFSAGVALTPAASIGAQASLGGLAYYDETFLPERFRWNLLVGDVNQQSITRFTVSADQASFLAAKRASAIKAPATGVGVGPDGQIFAAGKAGLVRITRADAPVARDLDMIDLGQVPAETLWKELQNQSWQRRYRAHVELTRRGGDIPADANQRLLATRATDRAFPSIIWLAARSGKGSVHLIALLGHADPSVREQAVRALTEFPEQIREEPVLARLLLDENSGVRLAAVLAHFSPKVPWNRAIQKVIEDGPACSEDVYLRQAATRLLAQKASVQQMEALCARFDEAGRLAGVLASGFRLTLPVATRTMESNLPLRSRTDMPSVQEYADGKFDLRAEGRVGQFTVAEHWKADMHTVHQEQLFRLLCKMLTDPARRVRVQAAELLWTLGDSRSELAVKRVLAKDK